MKYINLIVAALMGASFALAAPTLAKDPVQGVAGSLDTVASMFFKPLNIPVPGPSPEPTSIPVLFDRVMVKTRDPSKVICNELEVIFKNIHATPRDSVSHNIKQLRGRSDKPSELAAGHCDEAICTDQSCIVWCVNYTDSDSYAVDSWGLLADAAQAAMDTCSPKPEDGNFSAFVKYNDVWYAIVAKMDDIGE